MQAMTFTPWLKARRCDNDLCLQARWGKSTRSFANGDCLEGRYQRSSYCDNNACIEARHQHPVVQIRDSALGDASPILTFDPTSWNQFLSSLPVR